MHTRTSKLGLFRGLALGLPIYAVAAHLWTFALIAAHFAPHADFRALYAGAYLVWNGQSHELYNFDLQSQVEHSVVSNDADNLKFVSPAYYALLTAPLAAFSYSRAYLVLFGVNLAMLLVCILLLWSRLTAILRIYPWLPFALALGFHPAAAALIMGQNSIAMLLCVTVAYRKLESGRPFSAGAVLAIALFKYQFILPIGLLFLLWKRWRVAAGLGCIACLLILVSLALIGVHQAWTSVSSAPFMAVNLWPMIANIAGTAFTLLGISTWSRMVCAVGSLAVFAWTMRTGKDHSVSQQLLISIPCALLVSYHAYLHDLSIMLLPALLLLEYGLRRDELNYAAAGMLFLPMIESFASQAVFLLSLPAFGMLLAILRSRNNCSLLESTNANRRGATPTTIGQQLLCSATHLKTAFGPRAQR